MRSVLREAWVAALICLPRFAAADDAELRLHWVRGEGAERCVSEPVLDAALREALADTERARSVSLNGEIEPDRERGGFRARFDVRDASGRPLGRRELHSIERDCERVTPSLLLVLSVLAELVAVDPEPLPLTAAQASDEELPWTPSPEQAAAPARWQLQPSAATGFALGLSPEASLGFIVAAELRTPWPLSAALRGMYWPAGQSNFDRMNGQPAGIDFQMFQTELAACLPIAAPRDFRFDACWGATLLMRRARLVGLPVQHPSLRGTLGVSASLALTYSVSARWNIQLMTSFIGFARRDSYVYADAAGAAQPVYRASALAGAFSLGVGATL